jgi:hypothetical protein
VDHSTDMTDWQEFELPGFKLRFRYPSVTPLGHAVDRAEGQRGDAVRVHLASRDSQELYVEIVRFLNLEPRDEYASHRTYLERRFGGGSTTALTEARMGDLPAWTYAFRWDWGERSVLLFEVAGDTYRVIHDPAVGAEYAGHREHHDRGVTALSDLVGTTGSIRGEPTSVGVRPGPRITRGDRSMSPIRVRSTKDTKGWC